VRNGTAEGRQLRLFLVDMDELMIAGRVGELVDHLLIDQHPFGRAERLADQFLHFLRRHRAHPLSPLCLSRGAF
jgi:hypothetical protein